MLLTPEIDAGLQLGVTYRLVATVATNGAVSLKIFQGSTLVASLAANAGVPIAVSSVGFIIGRETDGFLTYLDNFNYTSSP